MILKRAIKHLSNLAQSVAALLLLGTMAVLLWGMVGRATLLPAKGIDELVGVLMIWAVYLSIPYVAASNRNVRVDLVVQRASPRVRRILHLLSSLAGMIFGLLMAWQGVGLVRSSFGLKQVTMLLELPVYLVLAVFPISMLLFAAQSLVEITEVLLPHVLDERTVAQYPRE